MVTKLPSERHFAKSHPIRAALIGVGSVALVGAGLFFGPTVAAQLTPAPTPSPTATEYVATLTPAELDSVQQAAQDQQTKIAADQAAAAQAAADAAAAQQAKQVRTTPQQPASGGLPAGSVVPSIPGTTSPDTTKCASGTASDNASGVAICD